MDASLQRRTTDHGRVYTDLDSIFLPSVTTVLDELPTPEGIKYWKKKYDGTGGNEHWEDILQYKSNRGTLIHYHLLNEFSDEDIGGRNETDSTEQLKLEGNWERYENEESFALNAWPTIKEMRGITHDSVIDVECFVTNTDIGYAGQFDLLYVDKNSNLVLSDLKTSKGVYDKHKLQLTAYENALNIEIDVLEVIRIQPDNQVWEVSHDSHWDEDRDDLWEEFVSLRNGMTNVEEEFSKIADEGIDDG